MSKTSQRLGGLSGRSLLAKTMKDNELFMMNLKEGVRGLGKGAIGVAAAEALKMAILGATKHDSSRAAANWDIAVGTDGRTTLEPANYGDPPIGKRGDSGARRLDVWEYKKTAYGIKHQTFESGFWEGPTPGGALWSQIGIGLPGNPPSVSLYNPIMGDVIQAPDGFGRSYAYNAFFGGAPAMFEDMNAGVAQAIGNGYIPWYVRQLNSRLKQASTGGTFKI